MPRDLTDDQRKALLRWILDSGIRLPAFERSFMAGVQRYKRLSERQRETIERLIDRYERRLQDESGEGQS